jgi:hypothetical protein
MAGQFVYMPVFRLRTQEINVLTSFNFGNEMYPCLEVIREYLDKKEAAANKPLEDTYMPIIDSVRSKRVFLDLPAQIKEKQGMQEDVLSFFTKIVVNMDTRTQYMLKFKNRADKIIPVISTYYNRSNVPNTIVKQGTDLRSAFQTLAFRTFELSIKSDLPQIKSIAQPQDFLIVDLEDNLADPNDEYIVQPIMELLADFDVCPVILVRNSVWSSITNSGLKHKGVVEEVDNKLMHNFRGIGCQCFGDYVGIKKDGINEARGRSPGFIFYDPVENNSYGFKGSDARLFEDFETIIIPAVYNSASADRMQNSGLGYLHSNNFGWQMIIEILKGDRKGKSPSTYKRIAMEHYLHCLRIKMQSGQI